MVTINRDSTFTDPRCGTFTRSIKLKEKLASLELADNVIGKFIQLAEKTLEKASDESAAQAVVALVEDAANQRK